MKLIVKKNNKLFAMKNVKKNKNLKVHTNGCIFITFENLFKVSRVGNNLKNYLNVANFNKVKKNK